MRPKSGVVEFDPREEFLFRLPNQEVTVRRLFVTVMFAACFLFLLPGRAHAWWHWLDQYSGPGPFTGPELQWRLVCINDPATIRTARKELEEERRKKLEQSLAAKAQFTLPPEITEMAVREKAREIQKRVDPGDGVMRSIDSLEPDGRPNFHSIGAAVLGLVGCPLQRDKSPVASLNFRTAFLWSIDNQLEYEKEAPRVHLWQPELSFSVFVDERNSVELMTGAGLSRASGEGFDPFWRFYWKPIVLTVTPVPLVRTGPNGTVQDGFLDRTARSFSISSSIVYMPKGFEAADFGARGPFKVERELVGTVAIVFDLSRF